jgi:hypothetical protein
MAGCRLCSNRVERFRLVGKVYKLCRVRIHSNGCVLGIGQVTVWSSHVEYEHGDLSSWLCIWLLWLSEYILVVIFAVISFTIVIFYGSLHYLSSYHLPALRGGTC